MLPTGSGKCLGTLSVFYLPAHANWTMCVDSGRSRRKFYVIESDMSCGVGWARAAAGGVWARPLTRRLLHTAGRVTMMAAPKTDDGQRKWSCDIIKGQVLVGSRPVVLSLSRPCARRRPSLDNATFLRQHPRLSTTEQSNTPSPHRMKVVETAREKHRKLAYQAKQLEYLLWFQRLRHEPALVSTAGRGDNRWSFPGSHGRCSQPPLR